METLKAIHSNNAQTIISTQRNSEMVASICITLESIMYRGMLLVRELQSMLNYTKVLTPTCSS